MNRKKLYGVLAGLLLFFLVFLLAKRGLFQNEPISSRSGKDIPNDVANNLFNWFHVDGQGKVSAAFSVVTSQGRVTVSSYLEYAKDKRAASRRHRAVQRELSPVLGSPVQEVPGFVCAWFPEKLQFSLMIVEDKQPPMIIFLLKEPLVEGR